MNLLDRVIAYFAPGTGVRRAAARSALAYEAQRRGRRADGWVAVNTSTSGDAEAGEAHADLRNMARSLDRDNPWASHGVNVLVANRIGSGIMMTPEGPHKKRSVVTSDRWKRWCDRCDITGRQDFYGMMALAERTRVVSGESLVRFVQTEMVDDDDVPLRLHLLEPDHIDSAKNQQVDDRTRIAYGVQLRDAQREGYWLFDQHPGDSYQRNTGSWQSSFVAAAEIIHYARALRPGQIRGITELANTIVRLRGIDDYGDAEMMRKRVAACLAAFVTTAGALPAQSIAPTTTEPGTTTGQRVETFRPGMITYLKPGETINVADPRPSSDYREFNNVELHAIAAGLNVPYELLTGDLSEVTYTSHRGGLVQFRGMVEADQWQLTIPQFCAPIGARWLVEARGIDPRVHPQTRWTYTPPRFGLLDPAKEIPAMALAIENGLDSWQNTLRREGYDPEEVVAEIVEYQEKFKDNPALNFLFQQPKIAANAGGVTPSKPEPDQGDEKTNDGRKKREDAA